MYVLHEPSERFLQAEYGPVYRSCSYWFSNQNMWIHRFRFHVGNFRRLLVVTIWKLFLIFWFKTMRLDEYAKQTIEPKAVVIRKEIQSVL